LQSPALELTLQSPEVISALHASAKETAWVECDNRVSSELHLRSSPAAVHLIPGILEKGVKVLMFAGAEDLICNYKGLEMMMDGMSWSGELGFMVSLVTSWSSWWSADGVECDDR
jgi:carboxypeptidase D